MSVSVGKKVRNFQLDTYLPEARDFGTFSLKQAKADGKWTILVFYPADFTFVCATEFSALAEEYPTLKEAGAEVITVSTDTKFTHLAWRDDEKSLANVVYPMGSDPTGEVSKLFGVYNKKTGLAYRGTFIINPEGVLLNAEVNELNIGRNMKELTRKLQADIYLAAHGDEACPANWSTGDKTLHPGVGLVGKVYEALNG